MNNYEFYFYPLENDQLGDGLGISGSAVGQGGSLGISGSTGQQSGTIGVSGTVKTQQTKPLKISGGVGGTPTMPVTKSFTIVGGGTLRTYSEPNNFQSRIRQELVNAGYSINSVSLNNSVNYADRTQWLRFLSPLGGQLIPTWNYAISISLTSAVNDNPDVIRQNIGNYLAQYFDQLMLTATGFEMSGGSLNQTSGNDFLSSLGASLGLSTPVVVGGLILFGIFYLKR